MKLIQYTYGANFMHLITFPSHFAIKDDYMTLDTNQNISSLFLKPPRYFVWTIVIMFHFQPLSLITFSDCHARDHKHILLVNMMQIHARVFSQVEGFTCRELLEHPQHLEFTLAYDFLQM